MNAGPRSDAPSDRGHRTAFGRLVGWVAGSRTACAFLVIGCILTAAYQEENWRGKRAWRVCKKELEAKGRRLDWDAFIPPDVPTDQNAFHAPLMQEFKRGGPATLTARMNQNAVFASATSAMPPLAEITFVPLADSTNGTNGTNGTDGSLELEYRVPFLSLPVSEKPPEGGTTNGEPEVYGPNTIIPLVMMDQVPLPDAIRNLARHGGLTYVLDPQVSFPRVGPDGETLPTPEISFRAENVTAFQVLISILRSNQLACIQDPKNPQALRITQWSGPDRRVYIAPSASRKIQELVLDCAVPSATSPSMRMLRGATGSLTLFSDVRKPSDGPGEDFSPRPRTARIIVRADEAPSAQEVAEFFRKEASGWNGSARPVRVVPFGISGFRVFESPPAFCRAADYLACTDQFEADFDLMREALKRPCARLDGDYRDPVAAPMPNFVVFRMVAQMLAQRAQAHLLLNQPEAALRELALIHDLCSLLENKPLGRPTILVAAMIDVALTGLCANIIADGFRLGAWQEPQLLALPGLLTNVHLGPLVSESLAAERAAVCHTLETASATSLSAAFRGASPPSAWSRFQDPLFLFLAFAPRGWVYQNLATIAKMHERTLEGYDPRADIIHPGLLAQAGKEIEASLGHRSPQVLLAGFIFPNFTRAWQTTAQNQTLLSQAVIACTLERYRRVHGVYPPDLDALVPDFAKELPHDVVNGQPFRYRPKEDGTFLLYSVGWNEVDDGGKAADGGPGSADRGAGDWVWPQFLPEPQAIK
jgi:hypothetical protein